MLLIEKGAKVPLPPKYRFIHNSCAHIYDHLTSFFKDEDLRQLRKTVISNISEDEKPDGITDILSWLNAQNRQKDLVEFLTKHLALSLLNDMCHFIYESLSCAKKGKMTVAYSLLRKPFTDELLILEHLLVNPTDFIDKFYHGGDARYYDPLTLKSSSAEIINAAHEKIQSRIFYSSTLTYQIRYDKSYPPGLQGLTNHALHIVTNDRNYKTSNRNFNFIFSVAEEQEWYWKNYYSIVPYLLCYLTDITDAILFKLLPDEFESKRILRALHRKIGLLYWARQFSLKGRNSVSSLLKTLNKSFNCQCPNCEKPIEIHQADLDLFFTTNILLCAQCFHFLLDEEGIKQIGEVLKYL